MRLKSMGFISVLVLVAAACGGGTDVTDAPGTTASAGGTETSSAPSDQSSPDSPPEASAPSGSGEFTVDGQSFQVTQVARCDPYDPNDENNPDDLDVVASSAEGVHLSLTISHGVPLRMENARRPALHPSLDVTFNFDFPSDITGC